MYNGSDFISVSGGAAGLHRRNDVSVAERVFRLPDPGYALAEVERRYADRAREIDRADGLSMTFDNWRFSLRRSAIEPLLRLDLETLAARDQLSRRQAEIAGLLASC